MNYKYKDCVNYIAIATAEAAGDTNEIYVREYENDVEISYSIDEDSKSVHLIYIESKNQKKGHATETIKSFVNEFINYTVEIEAVFNLVKWYEGLGFEFMYDIDDSMCCKMQLKR